MSDRQIDDVDHAQQILIDPPRWPTADHAFNYECESSLIQARQSDPVFGRAHQVARQLTLRIRRNSNNRNPH
ncbi:hypothetical protein, partial [Vibrio parahaemolyticus]|uniref:hypothetical protein n=1 Tax=Vibrio parahaemolyticus TaxID=670 RepID=UPI001A8C2DB6